MPREKVYLNADRSKKVAEGSPDAAFIYDADEAERVLRESRRLDAENEVQVKAFELPVEDRADFAREEYAKRVRALRDAEDKPEADVKADAEAEPKARKR